MSFVFIFRRRLQDVLIKTNMFTLALRLQKTSSRRLGQDQYIHLGHTSSRRFEDVFKTSSRHLVKTSSRRLAKTSSRRFEDVFKTSSRHLQDVFKTFSRLLQEIFKTSSRQWLLLRFNSCFPRSPGQKPMRLSPTHTRFS